MTFAILGGIGAAIAEGAVAAGTAIGSAGAAIGSGLAAGVGELGAGLGLAGAEAGTAAGAGAGTAAGTAAGSGSLIGEMAAAGLGGTAETAVGTGSTVGGLASGVGGGAAGEAGLGIAGALPVGTISNAAAPGLLGGLGSFAAQQVGGQAISQGVQGIQNAQLQEQARQNERLGAAQDAQKTKDAKGLGSQVYGLAAGGGVDLQDGDFIFPADVVSALGNGSTKAGAKFLDEFFGVA